MRSHPASRIGSLLGKSKASRLLDQARALAELDALLERLIPPPLNEHTRVLAVRDTTLVLAADSPVWAARLRFHTPRLVKQLRDDPAVRLRTVRVRVRPADPPEAAPRHLPGARLLSSSNADTLQQTARSISDTGLKAALMRLASRRK